jgi:hypothetical protein
MRLIQQLCNPISQITNNTPLSSLQHRVDDDGLLGAGIGKDVCVGGGLLLDEEAENERRLARQC